MFDLSIIIPSLLDNNFLKTLENLQLSIDGLSIEVIIVSDNKNITLDKYSDYPFQFYYNPQKGVASARNFGASIAKSDNLLFIDDDILITKESIEHVLEFIKTLQMLV